jgi:hypothetical protein
VRYVFAALAVLFATIVCASFGVTNRAYDRVFPGVSDRMIAKAIVETPPVVTSMTLSAPAVAISPAPPPPAFVPVKSDIPALAVLPAISAASVPPVPAERPASTEKAPVIFNAMNAMAMALPPNRRGYFPMTGVKPKSGRVEVVAADDGSPPKPAIPFHQAWAVQ